MKKFMLKTLAFGSLIGSVPCFGDQSKLENGSSAATADAEAFEAIDLMIDLAQEAVEYLHNSDQKTSLESTEAFQNARQSLEDARITSKQLITIMTTLKPLLTLSNEEKSKLETHMRLHAMHDPRALRLLAKNPALSAIVMGSSSDAKKLGVIPGVGV